jgi:hypothetical protein
MHGAVRKIRTRIAAARLLMFIPKI